MARSSRLPVTGPGTDRAGGGHAETVKEPPWPLRAGRTTTWVRRHGMTVDEATGGNRDRPGDPVPSRRQTTSVDEAPTASGDRPPRTRLRRQARLRVAGEAEHTNKRQSGGPASSTLVPPRTRLPRPVPPTVERPRAAAPPCGLAAGPATAERARPPRRASGPAGPSSVVGARAAAPPARPRSVGAERRSEDDRDRMPDDCRGGLTDRA